jgi:hypothetical protein
MKRFLVLSFVMILLLVAVVVHAGNKITVQSMPPVVVETFPRAGMINIDPLLSEIRVKFSKEMMVNNMWSWVMISKDTFPQITGEVRYLEDKKTCVAPVSLEPGKTYAIWFNSKNYNSFRDLNNNPAVPFLLVFQTKK